MNTQIKQSHLVIMQEILAFIQERGWDLKTIEIRRYEKGEYDEEEKSDEWRKKNYKWYLCIETEPRDQDKLPKRVKAGLLND